MTSSRPRPAVIVLMSLVTLWSGGLAVGFGFALASGRLGSTRTLFFSLACGLLAVLALRTAYELIRALRRS